MHKCLETNAKREERIAGREDEDEETGIRRRETNKWIRENRKGKKNQGYEREVREARRKINVYAGRVRMCRRKGG